jgi:hypothetical protein
MEDLPRKPKTLKKRLRPNVPLGHDVIEVIKHILKIEQLPDETEWDYHKRMLAMIDDMPNDQWDLLPENVKRWSNEMVVKVTEEFHKEVNG